MAQQHPLPSKAEVDSYLRDRRNWGRWGSKGGAGAINLITPQKRVAAARLVRSGRAVCLSRPFPVTPSVENARPAQHYMWRSPGGPNGGGAAFDYYGIYYHGQSATHIDALCHTWDDNGMWDGKDPNDVITFSGARYGGIDEWRDGILTRGVLLDVPRHRGKPYVTIEEPVHGWELEAVAASQGLKLEPGDAVAVYSGREAYAREHGGFWGGGPQRPGLHESCLPFLRDHDISVLLWDMMDIRPTQYQVPWGVHGAIFAYGIALVDNALLEPLAKACAEDGRYEFMLSISPLNVAGGTGSPVNPIAVF